jgi:membrane fusion protein (multidrug efflux system)
MEVSRVQTLILLLIALDLSECHAYGRQPQEDARKITVAVVQSKSATVKQSYKCRIDSQRYIQVRAPVEGQLAAILVKEGQAVKRGDLLFQVGPLGDEEKPEAEDRDKVVSIKAPCDGLLVGPLSTLRGSRIRKGGSLATLSDNCAMWVHSDMTERRYLALMTERGEDWRSTDLELILADHSKYPHTGKIVDFLASFNNETGDITFVAEFPNPDGVLRRGQTGTLLINRGLKDAILIPQRAAFDGLNLMVRTGEERIADSNKLTDKFPPDTPIAASLKGIRARFVVHSKRYVYVVGKDHVAHRREIVIQDDADDIFVVEKGVVAGDRIVVDGVRQVRDGDKVE